jgi:hypothetical protein
MNPSEEVAALRAELESLRTENKMMPGGRGQAHLGQP